MIKTNPHSRFVLYTLAEIQGCTEIVLQTEKTGGRFVTSKQDCYLCEVVPSTYYPRNTLESLVAENITLAKENRQLRSKLQKLEDGK